MNIILLNKEEILNDTVCLNDYRARHIIKILKPEIGSSLRVGLLGGKCGHGRVAAMQTKPPQVSLEIVLDEEPPARPLLDLVLALPRPIMLKRILSQSAALGVGKIHLVNARRVEKSFWQASVITDGEYQKHLITGLEQGVDTRMPSVFIHRSFKGFIDDYLPDFNENYRYKITADPSGSLGLESIIRPGAGRVLYCVGPEGGWVDFELDKFRQAGFDIFHLGRRILKVDTAVVALHGYISAFLQR
ncbi:MAG: 16S rRNA (uracil(1498)-N(3))-methyltransferase [Deltaproteobacteria bacterium]|nr:MAG: 16S rRNA (uracil(1498)-N(3))-methyltransferase [Deltaproteobacteria bacterium]